MVSMKTETHFGVPDHQPARPGESLEVAGFVDP
jgi:hypothetical protein